MDGFNKTSQSFCWLWLSRGHIAHCFDKTATVVIGSTFPINTSFVEDPNFDIIDLGKDDRVYSPIRITADEFSDRVNEGIMSMDEQTEDRIIKSVQKMLKQSKNTQK